MNSRTKFSLCVLRHFFVLYPDQRECFMQFPSDVVVWEAIFLHLFQTPPHDTEVVTYPLERRAGSSDPRWDILFGELHALKAQKILIKRWRSNLKAEPQLKEAA